MTRENDVRFHPEDGESRNVCFDFELEVSRDEVGYANESEPCPNDMINLFERIAKETVLELEWTTPGRRPLTPEEEHDYSNVDGDEGEGLTGEVEKTDFDFKDEMSSLRLSTKSIRPGGSDAGLRGSAKKKTTSLDAILSNMARHRKLDMMEDDDDDLLP